MFRMLAAVCVTGYEFTYHQRAISKRQRGNRRCKWESRTNCLNLFGVFVTKRDCFTSEREHARAQYQINLKGESQLAISMRNTKTSVIGGAAEVEDAHPSAWYSYLPGVKVNFISSYPPVACLPREHSDRSFYQEILFSRTQNRTGSTSWKRWRVYNNLP